MTDVEPARLPGRFTARIVGVTFCSGYPHNIGALDARFARSFIAGVQDPAIPARLVRDPGNVHDPNAVQVWVDLPGIGMIGHVAARMAERLAPHLDADEQWSAEVVAVVTDPNRPDQPGISVRITRV